MGIVVIVLTGAGVGAYSLFQGRDFSETEPVSAVASAVLADLEAKGYDAGQLEISQVAIYEDWAVASVHNLATDTDDAQVVARWQDSTWKVIAGPATTFARRELVGAPEPLLAALVVEEEEGSSSQMGRGEATAVPELGTSWSLEAASTTTEETQAAYQRLRENLATLLVRADARIPELAAEINATLPSVPHWVYDELGDLSAHVQSTLLDLKSNLVPAGYEEAQANLEAAASWMIRRIEATAAGISAMWAKGTVTAGAPYFEEGRSARDAYRAAYSKYESALPSP